MYELTKLCSSSSSRMISTSLGFRKEKDCSAADRLLPGSIPLDIRDQCSIEKEGWQQGDLAVFERGIGGLWPPESRSGVDGGVSTPYSGEMTGGTEDCSPWLTSSYRINWAVRIRLDEQCHKSEPRYRHSDQNLLYIPVQEGKRWTY